MDRLTEHETLVAAQIEGLITNAMTNSERSRWAAEHHIGVSDIGHCREYVRRVLTQEEPSQEANGAIMAAFVGTALGDLTERELVKMYPDAIVQRKVNVSLEVGEYQLNLPGHPDVIRPGEVMDFKSKNGLAVVERTLQQEFQLVLYGKAAIDAGLVEREGLKLTLAYLDRSGAFGPRPVVHSWLYDEAQVEEAQQWLADVFYAIENDEEASRDKPRSWCEMWCKFAPACRGGDSDVTGLIEDEEITLAAKVYGEAVRAESKARRDKASAKAVLQGVSGHTSDYSIRWTSVPPSETPCEDPVHYRRGYEKIEVKERKDAL